MALETILVVTPRGDVFASAREALQRTRRAVFFATSAVGAMTIVARERVALLLVDDQLPANEREALAAALTARDPLARVLSLSSATNPGDAVATLATLALEVRAQLERLQMAERLKGELLAGASHELRSPLNVIVGYIELLRDGAYGHCSAEALAVLEKVRGNADHLLELVEEFLDLSRIESGMPAAASTTVPLTPFLRELAESFTVLVRTKPVVFEADIPNGLPAVAAESGKLRVIVQNLLSNAGKFTEHGSIRLSAMPLPAGRVAICVSDTGPGIPPEQHETIFGLFQQFGDGAVRAKGIGLGLALARRFARLMAGDVTVESRQGHGTTFTLTLPVQASGERGLAVA